MQPRELRSRVKLLKQELNKLKSDLDIQNDKLSNKDIEIKILKSKIDRLHIFLKESSDRKRKFMIKSSENQQLKDRYYNLWIKETANHSKSIKNLILGFSIACPMFIVLGYLVAKLS